MTAFLNYELFFRKDIDGPLMLTSPNDEDLLHHKILVKNIGWGSNFRDMASSYIPVLIEYNINP